MAEPIRVLLVERYGIVREGVQLLLGDAADIVVAGAAGDAVGALGLAARLVAGGGLDLVVTELALPDLGGAALAGRLKAAHPGLRVLFLAMVVGDADIAALLDGAGDGVVLKQDASGVLLAGIRAVVAGDTYLSPAIARRFLQQVRHDRGPARPTAPLSAREREVLGLLAGGDTSKAIACALGLQLKTVENHRASILKKLGVANTAAAIRVAYEAGLLLPRHDGAA